MTFEFPCDGCKRFLCVGVDREGQKVRCPGCGTVSVATQVANPMEEEEEIVEAQEAEEPFQARLSQIDRSIDQIDRQRARRHAAARKADGPCPNCRKPMKAGAVLCIECGFDLRKGRTRETKVKRFERDWVAGYPIWFMALTVAILLSELCVAVLLLLTMRSLVAVFLAPVLFVLTAPTLAMLGWFNVLHLSRDRQGVMWLHVRRHMCFLPYASEDLPLSEFKAVLIGYRNGVDARTGGLFLFLILPHLILFPIFLLLFLRILILRARLAQASGHDAGGIRGTYWVCLRDIRRKEICVYYGGNEKLTRDIAETVADAGDLEIVR